MSSKSRLNSLVDQAFEVSKGTLPVESCSGDNCGDALANFLNSGPLKDTGLALPRGGVGPGDLAGVGKARGASVLGRGDLSLDNLTPGTVIHMTRQPGDRNYEYGSTHIGIVDEDEQGNKMFKSFTAGKGWRTETIDQRFIDRLPAQITATNPVNPGGGWLAKVGNLLGPSAAHAEGLPKGNQDDPISKLVDQAYGDSTSDDPINKLIDQAYGEEAKVAPAPTIPTPTKSVVPDSDYNSMLYGQDPTLQPSEPMAKVSATIDPEGEEKAYKKFLKSPKKELRPKDLATHYHESMLGLVSSIPGVPSLGPPPPGGYDEMGNRLDAEGRSFTPARPDTTWTQAVDRLEGLGKDIIRIGKDPHSAIVGAAELGWDIGTFGLGLINATAAAIEHLPAGIVKMANGEGSVLDAYNVMKDRFQGMAELTDPGKQWMKKALGLPADVADSLVKALGGTPLPKGPSEAVGEAVMLPLTMTNSWFQGVADEIHNSEYPMPNTEGLLRFMGEGTGFFVMAKFHKGGIRGLKKGMDVLGKEINEFRGLTSKGFARGPDMDEAWRKLAEAKAGEVEGIATEIAKEFDPNRPIIDEVQVAGEEAVKKAEVVEEVPIVVEEPKPKPLTAVERIRAKKAKEVKVEGEVVSEPTPEPKPTPKPKVVPTPPERTVVETDPQTSSLRQDPEVTRVRAQAFDERAPRDLLSIHAKALNDVNRWLDGDEGVSIEPVRRLLSDLAAKVEDPAHDRVMLDMLGSPREVEMFKKISKESATWARRVKREKGGKAPKVDEVIPEVGVEEPAPKVNNLPSIEQKLEAPGVAEGKVKKIAEEESWKQAEVDAKVAEDTALTQGAIEKYYGKSLDELSDAEVISYMNKELLGKGGGTELYSGIPVHLIGKAIKNIFRKGKEELPGHEDFKLAMGAKKPDGKYQWKVLGLNSKTGKWDELSVFDTKKEARVNSTQRAVDASVEWTKLYREKMNDPLMQPEQAIALKKAERTDRRYDEMKAFKEGDFSKWWDSQKKFWGEAIHDQAGRVRSALLKHFGEAGQRLLSYIESVPGGARYGEEKFRQMTKEVYDGLGKNLTEGLDRYHMYKRFADIWSYNPEWKAPNGIKRDETMLNVLHFKERNGLSDADFKLIQERSELMFNHARSWVDEFLLATGIIGPEEAKALKSHDYSKMKYIQTYADVFDRSTSSKIGDVKVSNYDSGVDPLGKGGASIAEVDQRIVYNEIARRMAGRAANQRARQAMREFANQFPDNGMIWHKGIEGTKRPKGWVKDYVWDFETPVESVETSYPSRQPIWLHPDFAKQVATVGYDMSHRFAWATKLLGADLVRSLAVGTSAVWATVVGLPIDIMHTFFSPRIFKDGKEVGAQADAKAIYSPFFPKYLAEIGGNLTSVASDVWNRGPKYQAYSKYGGLLPFLTQRQSHITGHMQRPGKVAELLDVLSAHGKNTELLVRLGIMDRVVEQKAGELGITKDELWKKESAKSESDILRLATHVARENMPYGQTGWLVKALDRFIPFVGANYVGGRTFWRAATERPADFGVRVANIGAAAVGITAMSLLYNPKAYREIPEDDKTRNVTIPFMSDYLKFKDSKGEERTWHMKVPGVGGPMFFYNLFSGLTHKFMYDSGMTNVPPDYGAIIKSLGQNAPAQTIAPPVIAGLMSYVTNYSLWQDRNLFTKMGGKTFSWPQSRVEGVNDPNVAQLAKDIGGVTGLSPKRLQGSVGELIPKNNEFMWLFGKAYEGLLSNVPEKLQERAWQETIAKTPGFSRWFNLNIPDAYRQVGDASRWKQEAEVDKKNYLRKSEFDMLMEEKARGGEVKDKLRTFYRKVAKEDPEAMQRFMDDSTKLAMIEKMEHKSIWKGMLGKSDELKAMDFNERLKVESSPEEQKSLRRELGRLMAAGFIGESFFEELGRIRRKDKK